MAGGSLGDDDDDLITDINVTPLVDVVLVLVLQGFEDLVVLQVLVFLQVG